MSSFDSIHFLLEMIYTIKKGTTFPSFFFPNEKNSNKKLK